MTTRSTQTRNAARTLVAHAAIGFCVTASIAATGCRSGRPSLNLFGMRGEPSAETLAGTGPSLTYPQPPSSKATPNAIASIAGGTAPATTPSGMPGGSSPNMYAATSTAGLPTVNSTPGVPSTPPASATTPYGAVASQSNGSLPPASYALPGSQTPSQPASYAAASANGYAMGTQPSASTQTATPRPTAMPPISVPSTSTPAGAEAIAAQSGTPASKSNGFTLPGPEMDAIVAQQPSSSSKTGSAFSLPSDLMPGPSASTTASSETKSSPAVSAIGLPDNLGESISATKDRVASAASGATKATADAAAKAAAAVTEAPAYQTATGSVSGSSNSVRPAGYMPGSTGAASGYPSDSVIR
ncbi:hypothetical protein [Rhodopirellula sp. P2]|uniref:hypothetical protein n=1 Tax=Rhodopirellula sp. P2 TaxID=2127060 RepID=UPI0023687744|nr:hypothetical protein [Rhodopirellula sp. P2]WDQ14820.1 hypothetical protein PSR62_14345 [Rhodopirellula sp. P2]